MSSSTALLPKNRKDDHPIFLRVCHSPWAFINQQTLATIRGVIAAYMTVIFGVIIFYDAYFSKHGWQIPFELPNIIYLHQVLYFWMACMWTAMHLYYPHHGSAAPSAATMMQKIFSPPRQNQSTNNKLFYSIFYTAAVTFPFVVTLVYYLILVPHNNGDFTSAFGLTDDLTDNLFGHGWFKPFIVFNKYGVNCLAALIEVFVLSSVKRQELVIAHVAGLSFLSLCYFGWVWIGRLITGDFVYYFFDHNQVGWKYVVVAVGAMIGLVNTFFAFVYGLSGLREMLTRNSEDSNAGYQRLPQ